MNIFLSNFRLFFFTVGLPISMIAIASAPGWYFRIIHFGQINAGLRDRKKAFDAKTSEVPS